MTEAEFQSAVIDLARLGGWLCHHTRPARTATGWATAIQGHPGFPDLVLAHPQHGLILAELKSETGRLTREQWCWIDTLEHIESGHVRIHVWRPADWPEIVATLTPGAQAA